VKYNRETCLPETVNLLRLAQNLGSFRNQNVLAIVGVNITTYLTDDRTSEVAIEAIDEESFEYSSFKDDVLFTDRSVSRWWRRLRGRGRLRSLRLGKTQLLGQSGNLLLLPWSGETAALIPADWEGWGRSA